MKSLKEHLEKLRGIKRKSYHPLVHKIHKKYKVSKKTLFYIKEYGPHTNVTRTILRESIKILILSAIISAFGGLALDQVKTVFLSIIPLIVLLPTLNDMIGDYSTIVSSRFSTMLHEGKIRGKLLKNEELKKLYVQIIIVSLITAALSSAIAFAISAVSGYAATKEIAIKVFLAVLIDVALLITLLFIMTILAGLYFYRKKEDPNNFLIPITTSVADFGNMIILALLVIVMF